MDYLTELFATVPYISNTLSEIINSSFQECLFLQEPKQPIINPIFKDSKYRKTGARLPTLSTLSNIFMNMYLLTGL